MILSIHIADVPAHTAATALARPPRPGRVAGLRYGTTVLTAPLSPHLLPVPRLGRVGLIGAWDCDEDVDRFLADDRLAAIFAGGFQARMRAVHAFGSFAPLDGLVGEDPDIGGQEPAGVLTIGRLRLRQTVRFLRASAAAEGLAASSAGMIAATGLARPPRLVSTFSLWRGKQAMRAYAGGGEGPAHRDAVRAHAARSFHHEAAFIRLRPYAIEGALDGVELVSEHTAA
jgi:hypothetical protein